MSLQDGLVGWWELNDGLAVDSSGNSLKGTVFGAIATKDRHGQVSRALDFDGTDDYVAVGPITIADNTPWTFSVWVKFDTLSSGGWRAIYGNAFISTKLTRLIIDASRILLYNDANIFAQWTPVIMGTGNWRHIVITANGENAENVIVYVNNISFGAKTLADTSQTIRVLGQIGDGVTPAFLDGAMSDVRIYNRVLSADEMLALYKRKPIGIGIPVHGANLWRPG